MDYKFSKEFDNVIKAAKEKFSIPLTSEKVVYGMLSNDCDALHVVERISGINLLKIQSELFRIIEDSSHSRHTNEEYSGNILHILEAINSKKSEIDSLSFLNQIFSVDCLAKNILERNGLAKTKINNSIAQKKMEKDKREFYYFLTDLAHQQKLDLVVGREKEISQCINILLRRLKNNPLLIGKPGVGKTAIVEGLANRISTGMVPERLKNKKIAVLEIGKLVAGTKYRGEFEEKLYKFLKDVQEDGNTIVFIDEIHTIMGTGAAEGGIDAGNLLKPSLARGDIQFIGATTFEEYRLLQTDKALERRFQLIKVNEPSIQEMIEMAKTIRITYEKFHNKIYDDEVLNYAIYQADKFIPHRYFPDKFIDIIDEAGVISTSNKVTISDIEKVIESYANHLTVLNRDILDTNREVTAKFTPIQSEINSISNMIKNSITGVQYKYKVLGSLLLLGKPMVILDEVINEVSLNYNLPVLRIDFDALDASQLYLHLFDTIHGVITNWIKQNGTSIIFFESNCQNNLETKIINKILGKGYITDQYGNYIDLSNVFIIAYFHSNVPNSVKNSFDKVFDLGNLSKDKYIDLLISFTLNSMKRNLHVDKKIYEHAKEVLFQKIFCNNNASETCEYKLATDVINQSIENKVLL